MNMPFKDRRNYNELLQHNKNRYGNMACNSNSEFNIFKESTINKKCEAFQARLQYTN